MNTREVTPELTDQFIKNLSPTKYKHNVCYLDSEKYLYMKPLDAYKLHFRTAIHKM